MDAEDISTFLLKLYEKIQQQNEEDYAEYSCTLLQRVLPFDSGYVIHSGRYSLSLGPLYDGISLFRQPPEKLKDYAGVKQADLLAQRIITVPQVVHRLDVRDSLPKHNEYDDIRRLAKTYDVNHVLGMSLHKGALDAEGFLGISLARHSQKYSFTAQEGRLAAYLAPHMMQAQAMHRRWQHANSAPVMTAAPPEARLIANTAGCIAHADPAALSLLRREWKQWDPPILPLELLLYGDIYRGRCIEVQLKVISKKVLMLALRPCQSFRLTAAQWPIVQRVAQGMSHKKIAKELNLSDFTVRNHLSRIYKQVGIHNKAELLNWWHQGRFTGTRV